MSIVSFENTTYFRRVRWFGVLPVSVVVVDELAPSRVFVRASKDPRFHSEQHSYGTHDTS